MKKKKCRCGKPVKAAGKCDACYMREWRAVNRDRNLENQRRWRTRNPERVKELERRSRSTPKAKARIAAYMAKYRSENKERIAKKAAEYWKGKEGFRLSLARAWRQKNRKWYQDYHRKRMKNPKYVLNARMRARVYESLGGAKAGRKWESLVGYSVVELRDHIQRLFQPGMTWDNRGLWHIDHVRPISSFEFNSAEDSGFRECWSLKNLQPLWASQNLSKRNKWKKSEVEAAIETEVRECLSELSRPVEYETESNELQAAD